MTFIASFIEAFILGLLTPLTAVCVLPLFPGFLAYLANKISRKAERKLLVSLGFIITAGVLTFMFLLGIIFTTILQISLTSVIGIVSPIAFVILVFISLFLIFDINIGRFLPKVHIPNIKNPKLNAFIFGFFFGAIVIPCNPLFIAALFARTVVMTNFLTNIANFMAFGLGISFPLLLFSVLSTAASSAIINTLIKYRRVINIIAGLFMLTISLYYLIFVFRIFG